MNTEPLTILPAQDEYWDMDIEPRRNLLDLRLGELWRYRDLVMLFVRSSDVVVTSTYHHDYDCGAILNSVLLTADTPNAFGVNENSNVERP
jgi:hypothetical protein